MAQAGATTTIPREYGLAAAAIVGMALGVAILLVSPLPILLVVGGLAILLIAIRYPIAALLIYLMVEFTRPGEIYPIAGAAHVQRILGIMLLLAMVSHWRRTRRAMPWHGLSTIMVALVAVMAASIATAVWRGQAAETTVEFAKMVLIFLAIVYLVDTPSRMALVLATIVLVGAWLAVTLIIGYQTGTTLYPDSAAGFERAGGQGESLGHPNSQAAIFAAFLPFVYFGLLGARSRGLKVVLGAVLALFIVGLVLTGSRSGQVAAVFVVLLLAWKSPRRYVAIPALVGALVVAWLLMPARYQERLLSVEQYQQDASSMGRLQAWAAGWRMFIEHPVLGIGAGNFSTAHALGYSRLSHPNWLNAHSVYVQVLAELGVVGGICFVALVWVYLRTHWRLRRGLRNAGLSGHWAFLVSQALEVSMIATLVTGIWGHNLYRFRYPMLAALTVALWSLVQAAGSETAGASAVASGETRLPRPA
jgi:putative inorganic carbon (HCO3(-)) transporter